MMHEPKHRLEECERKYKEPDHHVRVLPNTWRVWIELLNEPDAQTDRSGEHSVGEYLQCGMQPDEVAGAQDAYDNAAKWEE